MSLWVLWSGTAQKTSFISPNKAHWANILWAQELAKGSWVWSHCPRVLFLLSYLFQVPFCYLDWKFHTCSAQRNAAHADQRACQEIGNNFSFVASFHLWLPLSHLWGRLCYCLSCSTDLFQLGSKCFQVTFPGEPCWLLQAAWFLTFKGPETFCLVWYLMPSWYFHDLFVV